MKIGNFSFKNSIFLAPMAGVTDVGFRAIARAFGAEMAWTEMVSAKGLIYGEKKACKTPLNPDFLKQNPKFAMNKSAWLLLSEPIEDIKVVQFFGSDPKFMAEACKNDLLKDFDIIDINMGCPAPKIIRNGEGSALMQNIDLAREIIKACVKASNKPITVKFRKGYKKDNAVEFAKMCEDAGASAITIHARLMTQGYSGQADLDTVRAVKNAVNIPVIASGDIRDFEGYKRVMETGVDGVMLGRITNGNQIIFKNLIENIEQKHVSIFDFVQSNDFFKKYVSKEEMERLKENPEFIRYICAKIHVGILRKYYADAFLAKYMRKHFLWYVSGLKIDTEIKQKIALSDDIEQSLKIIKEL